MCMEEPMKRQVTIWCTECLLWFVMILGVVVPAYLIGLTIAEGGGGRRLIGVAFLAVGGPWLTGSFYYLRKRWRAAGCPNDMKINF